MKLVSKQTGYTGFRVRGSGLPFFDTGFNLVHPVKNGSARNLPKGIRNTVADGFLICPDVEGKK